MSKPDALGAALDLATRNRDEAARQLALARQAWVSAQMQLDQLQGYSQETDGRWSLAAGRAATPELMRHHYQFMQRLDQAIQIQVGVVDTQARQIEARAASLRECEARLGAFKQLLEQRAKEAQREQRRRDQKAVDEIAAQQYRRHNERLMAGGR